jgi:predicted unusual protein kinase regulating ubiquinone biosynthesis (AarF/ABC1/UbiB family)
MADTGEQQQTPHAGSPPGHAGHLPENTGPSPEATGTQDASRNGNGRVDRGRLRRTAPLVGLTARTAGEAVVVGLRSKLTGADTTEFHIRSAERYAELLGRSKGALMKAGQMLSFVSLGPAVEGNFQSTYQAALRRLRNDAPPMAPGLARETLERELGRSAESVFAEFQWRPIAAASIGQVHTARLHDGRDVAVKIQYPGVDAAIRDDLKNTELLVTFLGLMSGLSPRKLKFDLRGAAQELGERITEELDYRREAANQAEFAAHYRGHPYIHVPEVIEELSTDRVLTQELVLGKSWSEALTADQELRNSWAEAIHRFTYDSYRAYCMFNADPHPGNYLLHDDGSVSFLDFGCVKRLRRTEVESLDLVLREVLRGDVGETWRLSVEYGFFAPSASLTPEEVFAYWRKPIEMYWGTQPFTITTEYLTKLIELRYSPTGPSANALRHVVMPVTYTIMTRLDIGVMSVISELRATNHWRAIAEEYFEDADPGTPMAIANRAYREDRERTKASSMPERGDPSNTRGEAGWTTADGEGQMAADGEGQMRAVTSETPERTGDHA